MRPFKRIRKDDKGFVPYFIKSVFPIILDLDEEAFWTSEYDSASKTTHMVFFLGLKSPLKQLHTEYRAVEGP